MNIFNSYDKIIENIQQIPLDVYLFVRRNRRLHLKVKKLTTKYNKILKMIYKGNVINNKEFATLNKKIQKHRMKLIDSSITLQNIIQNIFDKSGDILTEANEFVPLPEISIDNINRIVKAGKIKEKGKNYCICRQKAYDNMIACDDTRCKTKWFHFECAGITLPPKNTWVCFDCKKLKEREK
ncbi:chromatin modification-related protein YNG2 [Vairimorpha necatrix]|uniref:Chromatin modification-related protein YNG2 n=1 Tax=Vairimorpha necatrix TaxID=6039 RepID=A0AAX4JDL8_9MICR